MTNKPLISFDYAIKYLLKDKGDYDIVEGFISALLAAEGYGPVKITALLDGESNKEHPSLKRSIADLIVEDKQGQKYIVEIEREYVSNFMYKACFNTSRLIVDSIQQSEDYDKIKKVFHITLLYFTWGNMKKPLYHSKIITREVDSEHPIDLHISDQGGTIYRLEHIFPEYFFISVPLFDDVIKKEMDEWLYVMKHSEVREDFKSPYMKKVGERLNILTMNAQEQGAYYRYLKENLTKRDQLTAAEAKGESKGIKKGIKKGREEGIEEGKNARNVEIAKHMLSKGYSLDVVAELTGLSQEELEELQKSIQ